MASVIGIDIGGTFIDVVSVDDTGIRIDKFPSTPDTPAEGLFAGLSVLIEAGHIRADAVRRVVHGSTVATNALLERTWSKTALITTEGFRDVLEIGRQARDDLYDLVVQRQAPIAPRDLRFEVRERIGADGAVLQPLDGEQVSALAPTLREEGVETVAIVFLFSFLRPEHERKAREALRAAIDLPVTLSSDVLAEFREYERASTTVVCAALRPVIEGYLGQIEREARRRGLPAEWQIMQSSGTVTSASRATKEPARIVLSGPAAGVEGARRIGRLAGEPDLITLDMGGTSCDVSLVRDGAISRSSSGKVAGHPISMQMTDIHTIGAGGGSIVWIDAGGALRVGPQSAGGDPGPACYGRGGQAPTVTDAHVVLGHLLVERPLAGLDRLDADEARRAVASIAEKLCLSVEQAALGILRVADAAMERAIRVISIERGVDPRGYALLAFGGAGPLHAVSIARGLSIPRVVVPAVAGVLSAFGLVAAEAGREGSRSIVCPVREVDLGAVNAIVDDLAARGTDALIAEGVEVKGIRILLSADLRYAGQSHELEVAAAEPLIDCDVLDTLEAAFHEAHRERFGHAEPERVVEWVTVRVRVIGPEPGVDVGWARRGVLEAVDAADVWFDAAGPVESKVYVREDVPRNAQFGGPALFVGRDATLLVPPGISGRADAQGAITLEIG